MKRTLILLCIGILLFAVFFCIKKYNGGKPGFYANIIAKQVENLLEDDTIAWAEFGIKLKGKKIPYGETCKKAKNKKIQLASTDIFSAGKAFEELLLNEIIPYWYGTTWDFNGHTDTPKKGKVACGYFVSTTLQHLGLNVNRYHLAQQSPENEAKSLAFGNGVIEIMGENSAENLPKIHKAIDDGICFVGLGNSHVGYLLKRKGELFFVHSSYLSPGAVTIEKAARSAVFCAYRKYYIVELSSNEAFIKRWLKNQKIEILGS